MTEIAFSVGDLIRIVDGSDALEGTTTPYGQVVGFLPVGGIQVVQPEAGLGIFNEDDLMIVPLTTVDATLIAAMEARTGIPVRKE